LTSGVETKAWRRLAGRSLESTLLAVLRDAICAVDMIFLAEVNPSPGQLSVEIVLSRWPRIGGYTPVCLLLLFPLYEGSR
jgi:hypothetical protein